MLDLFQQDYDRESAPQPNEGRDLAPTFGESFQDSWSNGQLATSGIKQSNARTQAVQDYIDKIQAAGGDVNAEYSKQLAEGSGITTVDAAGGGPDPLEVANGVVAKMKASADAAGRQLPFTPLTSDDIDNNAAQISRNAIAVNSALQAKPQTFGSRVGSFLGGAASATVDPYNIPMLAVPVEGLGILGTAAAFGGASALTQAVNEGVNAGFNEKVQPGYNNSDQALGNIAEAGVSGALLGGGVKAAGNVLTRLMTGAWPTAAKDAANGVMSEADILNSNTHPSAAVEPPSSPPPAEPEVFTPSQRREAWADAQADIDQARTRTPSERNEDLLNAQAAADAARTRTPSERQFDIDTDVGRTVQTPSERETGTAQPRVIGADQILPGAEGEAAHSAALGKAIDDVLRGDPVDVSDAIPDGSDFEGRIGDLPSEYGTTAGIGEGEPTGTAEETRPGSLTPDQISEQITAPDTMNAMRADVEKAIDESAQGGKALQIPVGVDNEGEPIWGSATSALGEVDRMNEFADQIAQCALPGAMQQAEAAE